jgi:hypothetical protein
MGYINGESVSYVAGNSSVVSYVDLFGLDDLNITEHFLLAAEVQHVLSLLNATDEGANELLSSDDEVEGRDGKGGSWCTDQDELTVDIDGLH